MQKMVIKHLPCDRNCMVIAVDASFTILIWYQSVTHFILTFSINPFHRSLPYLIGWISRIFTTISQLNFSSVFLFFFTFAH